MIEADRQGLGSRGVSRQALAELQSILKKPYQDVCNVCEGSGRVDARTCGKCKGSGQRLLRLL